MRSFEHIPSRLGERSRNYLLQRNVEIEALFEAPMIESLGFSTKLTGGHMARSMMFNELTQLTREVPVAADREQYRVSIVEDNILDKPTQSSREKSYRHLVELYGLDRSALMFHVLRVFAVESPDALPLIALILAFGRDPQLRHSFKLVASTRISEHVSRQAMEEHLEYGFPGRFSEAMKKSLAQNVNTTWSASGHLEGRSVKLRRFPNGHMLSTVYGVMAGYLLGQRGDELLSGVFMRLASVEHAQVLSHLSSASAAGWLRFRHGGGITEIDFDPVFARHKEELQNVQS